MQITGNITNIVPDGGYDSQGGYIHTFQMTVQGPNGPVTGQIGSKSTVYPMQVGEEIIVDMTNGQHGPRLKKVNPKYAQGGQQSQGGQGQRSAPQTSYTPPSQEQPDWDKIAEGKCKCAVICAAIQGGQMTCKNNAEVQAHVDYMMGKPANTGMFTAEEQAELNKADGIDGGPEVPF